MEQNRHWPEHAARMRQVAVLRRYPIALVQLLEPDRMVCPYTVGTFWLRGFKMLRGSLIREAFLFGRLTCLCQHKGPGVHLVGQMFPAEAPDLSGIALELRRHISPGHGKAQRAWYAVCIRKILVSKGEKEKTD